MPHLRDGFIVAKVGYFRGSENPDTLNSPMPSGLIRLQREGDDHFITFSCYRLWLKVAQESPHQRRYPCLVGCLGRLAEICDLEIEGSAAALLVLTP